MNARRIVVGLVTLSLGLLTVLWFCNGSAGSSPGDRSGIPSEVRKPRAVPMQGIEEVTSETRRAVQAEEQATASRTGEGAESPGWRLILKDASTSLPIPADRKLTVQQGGCELRPGEYRRQGAELLLPGTSSVVLDVDGYQSTKVFPSKALVEAGRPQEKLLYPLRTIRFRILHNKRPVAGAEFTCHYSGPRERNNNRMGYWVGPPLGAPLLSDTEGFVECPDAPMTGDGTQLYCHVTTQELGGKTFFFEGRIPDETMVLELLDPIQIRVMCRNLDPGELATVSLRYSREPLSITEKDVASRECAGPECLVVFDKIQPADYEVIGETEEATVSAPVDLSGTSPWQAVLDFAEALARSVTAANSQGVHPRRSEPFYPRRFLLAGEVVVPDSMGERAKPQLEAALAYKDPQDVPWTGWQTLPAGEALGDGRFRFAGEVSFAFTRWPPPWRLLVRAEVPGHAPVQKTGLLVPEPDTEVDFGVLRLGGDSSIRVVVSGHLDEWPGLHATAWTPGSLGSNLSGNESEAGFLPPGVPVESGVALLEHLPAGPLIVALADDQGILLWEEAVGTGDPLQPALVRFDLAEVARVKVWWPPGFWNVATLYALLQKKVDPGLRIARLVPIEGREPPLELHLPPGEAWLALRSRFEPGLEMNALMVRRTLTAGVQEVRIGESDAMLAGKVQPLQEDVPPAHLLLVRGEGVEFILPVHRHGSFAVTGLDPGVYRVRVLDPSSSPASSYRLEWTAGDPLSDGSVRTVPAAEGR